MQHTFYKPDGTVIVSVTGNVGLEGENTNTYSVIYGKLDPGLSEKSILGMNEQRIVCK